MSLSNGRRRPRRSFSQDHATTPPWRAAKALDVSAAVEIPLHKRVLRLNDGGCPFDGILAVSKTKPDVVVQHHGASTSG